MRVSVVVSPLCGFDVLFSFLFFILYSRCRGEYTGEEILLILSFSPLLFLRVKDVIN